MWQPQDQISHLPCDRTYCFALSSHFGVTECAQNRKSILLIGKSFCLIGILFVVVQNLFVVQNCVSLKLRLYGMANQICLVGEVICLHIVAMLYIVSMAVQVSIFLWSFPAHFTLGYSKTKKRGLVNIHISHPKDKEIQATGFTFGLPLEKCPPGKENEVS